MKTTDNLKDPYFMPILLAIESRIGAADKAATAQGLEFTDSQVRSILNKARKHAEGGAPDLPGGSPREQALAALYQEILKAREEFGVEDSSGNVSGLPKEDWAMALRTVEDSIKLRSTGAGSRAYLEFLEGFLGQAEKHG